MSRQNVLEIWKDCRIDGCDAPISYKGMCKYHYKRMYYKGDSPPHPSKRVRIIKICVVHDCDKKVQAVSLCSKHYRSYHRWKTNNIISNREEFLVRLASK